MKFGYKNGESNGFWILENICIRRSLGPENLNFEKIGLMKFFYVWENTELKKQFIPKNSMHNKIGLKK